MLVGTGRAHVAKAGHRAAVVRIALNANGRRRLGRATGGMRVRLVATARGRGSKLLSAHTATLVYPQRVMVLPTINPFVFDATRMVISAAYHALHAIVAEARARLQRPVSSAST